MPAVRVLFLRARSGPGLSRQAAWARIHPGLLTAKVLHSCWAFACMFESYFVTVWFDIRAGPGVVQSFVEVVSSFIGLRSTGPKQVSEFLCIFFTSRAAGVLVGPILGVLLQVGSYPAPGVFTSALTFVTMLLALKPVSLVEHEHARQAEIGIFELLKVSGMASGLALITSPMVVFSS